MKKDKKKNKAMAIIKMIARIFLFILLVGFILSVCLQRFSDNKISIFNYRMFTVITGSMEPKYKVGDVLISKEVKPSSVKVGDTISYLGAKGDFKGKVITHEVVGIETENNKLLFRAKGLANLVEDPIVSEDQLYGVVIYKSFFLSIIYKIVGTKIGMFLFVIIPLMFIIISEIISTLLEKEDERRNKLKREKIDKTDEEE